MRASQVESLKKIFTDYSVSIDKAGFRFDLSKFGDGDFFSGVSKSGKRAKFRNVFNVDPTRRKSDETGNKLKNWIGDYDALMYHFLNNRDVFVTYDMKVYMTEEKRKLAHEQLGLLILGPEQAKLHLAQI